MTGSETRKGRGRDARPRWLTLRVLCGILTVAPVALLFASISGSTGDDIAADTRERQGIEYLTGLGPLATVLTAAQSDAVAGRVPSADALSQASSAVDNVDARPGDPGAHSLWLDADATWGDRDDTAARRGRLRALHRGRRPLLALFDKVRTSAGLVRDPAIDANSSSTPRPRTFLERSSRWTLRRPGRWRQAAPTRPWRSDRSSPPATPPCDSATIWSGTTPRWAIPAAPPERPPVHPLDEFRLAMDGIAKSAAFGDSVVSQQDIAAIRSRVAT
jgi:hypothetical protein